MANNDDIKDAVVKNQKLIDELNANLERKKQEVRIIQEISAEINTSMDLDQILQNMLTSLDQTFGFKHSMILLKEPTEDALAVAASHGYEDQGLGAKVLVGQGIIGVVAKHKKLMRMGNVGMQMNYLNAVKSHMHAETESVQLPGLKNVQSKVAIPLLYKEALIGVIAVESDQPNLFDERDEVIVSILANQAASAIVKAKAHKDLLDLNEHLEDKVKARTAEVTQQKTELQEKNNEITDSIKYAKRIQDSLLTADDYIQEHLPESFVLFLPKDIVSGDFYWINKKEDTVYFSAIDCTGHGVPGAFVSIVAHGSLQRAVHIFKLRKTNEILDKVNETVTKNFELNNLRDGMDMALCRLNTKEQTLEYSGANNPIYIVRKEEEGSLKFKSAAVELNEVSQNGWTLFEIKPNKQPIGRYEHRKPFDNHEVDLKPGDIIYNFSDGYADQFGGPKGKKIKYGQFKRILLKNASLSMVQQKAELNQFFEQWKADYSQIDDVCVIGVRV